MSLIVTPAQSSLTIKDTTLNIPEVFIRLNVFMPASNKKMLIELSCYQDRAAYDANSGPISLNEIAQGTTEHTIPNGSQLLAAHELVKAELITAGYNVQIIDL